MFVGLLLKQPHETTIVLLSMKNIRDRHWNQSFIPSICWATMCQMPGESWEMSRGTQWCGHGHSAGWAQRCPLSEVPFSLQEGRTCPTGLHQPWLPLHSGQDHGNHSGCPAGHIPSKGKGTELQTPALPSCWFRRVLLIWTDTSTFLKKPDFSHNISGLLSQHSRDSYMKWSLPRPNWFFQCPLPSPRKNAAGSGMKPKAQMVITVGLQAP